jgi:dTMP kinase
LTSTPSPRPGRFITVEGIDGAGKSTHLPWLRQVLERRGHAVWVTREPGGTALGEKLRSLLLAEPMTRLAETLLMFAARREHCEREIWPRLATGTWVLCDRFTDATFAYQGGGHGVARETIAALERDVLEDFRPDATVVFDIPVQVSRERLTRLADRRALDKFEREGAEFFERVRAVYLERAQADPGRCRVIDSTAPRETVAQALEKIVSAL